MEKQIKDALNDSVISEMRDKLSKHRSDILNDYDSIILKMEKNECDTNLIADMHKLLGAIVGDISAKKDIEAINQTEYYKNKDDSETFTLHKNVITLFNFINKCIEEKFK